MTKYRVRQDPDYSYAWAEPMTDNDIKKRQQIERKIIRRLVTDALTAGFCVKVDTGEEEFGPFSSLKPVMDKLFSVDTEWLLFYKSHTDEASAWAGSVCLIHGNDGHDVIADYSTSIEELLVGANNLADSLQ